MIEKNSYAIQFQDVYLTIQQQQIIKGVSGKIPTGKITTLVGPSGAGKSTLLKMCNRLISQTSGSIYIDNETIEHYNPVQLRQNVGIALQDAPMIKGTVYDNLKLPKVLQKQFLTTADATSILQDVGLDKTFLQKDASNLSGGQKQRVSIARTLINKNKILLLDEITSALDYTSAHEIEQLILKLNQKYGVTIIWITHDLQQALKLSDYIWFLKDGHLIWEGDAEKMKTSNNTYVQNFFTEIIE
ncbi:MAG: phosphate ABC transporter ATP-binding protein [Kurthia sp.]|nr:phosphate ABC transporter ATP-binding protein [Candidatus Kurthia equi]